MLSTLLIEVAKLPQVVEAIGKKGEREYYLIKAASRKFGLCVVKLEEPLRSQYLRK